MVAQFLISGFIYFLLLVLTLGEEFQRCPAPLQSLCCWIHETKSVRTLLTLTAIAVNFGVASSDIVSQIQMLFLLCSAGVNVLSASSLQLWCDSSDAHINSSDSVTPPTSTWPVINICTHPEVRSNTTRRRPVSA